MTGTDWTWEGSGAFDDGRIESGMLRVNGILTSPVTVHAGTTLGGIGTINGDVLNKGVVAPGNSIGTLTINGDYSGDGGTLLIESELGDDASPSDKLVIGGGSATGATLMQVVNVGGAGGLTTGNGIPVVEAVNGGTTALDAFMLAGRVVTGPYEYALYRGGLDVGSEADWFLRSTAPPVPEPVSEPEPGVPDPPPPGEPVPPPGSPPPQPVPAPTAFPPLGPTTPDPTPPATPFPPVVPGQGVPPPTPGATPVVADVVPLYRVEVPTYAVVPPVAHHLAISTLGTFHERRGEQALLDDAGWLPAAWGRVFGQDAEMKWDGTVAPSFDGSVSGLQAGLDLFGGESAPDHHDRVGLFVAHASMDGDVKGQALGWNDLQVGEVDVDGTSLGAYWTHVGPNGWYLDGIVMGTWFDGASTSSTGESIDIDGTGVTASAEGGYPSALTPDWTLEPQAQIIWQQLSLDDQADSFSTVSFDSDDAVTGRLGLRLQGEFEAGAGRFQPYLKANLWHQFDSENRIVFAGTPITTENGGTALGLGGGVTANLSEPIALFATADYTFDVGGEEVRVLEGNIGLSVKW